MDDHTPRVFRSESFERKQKMIRDEVRKIHPNRESVLELGGCVRDRHVVVVDCLIPEADLDYCSFKVSDQALSRCWAKAGKAKSTTHLSPIGDLHYHPETGGSFLRHFGPRASSEDEENSLRLAGLYHTFNLQETVSEFAPEAGTCPSREAWFEYEIDPYTCVQIKSEQSINALQIMVKRKQKKSYWASLIRTSDGNPEYDRSYVIEHLYSAGAQEEPRITRYEDVPSVVISDEETSDLTGWPMDKIRLELDRNAIASEVSSKYRKKSHIGLLANQYTDSFDEYDRLWQWHGQSCGLQNMPYQQYKQYLKDFIYLREDASLNDVGTLLREIAKLLESDVKLKSDEVGRALGESMILLIGQPSKLHDRN